MQLLFDVWEARVDQTEILRYVKTSDRRLWLDLNSSQLNHYLIDILVSEFTQAKFIVTIRDCHTWLDSFVNHQIYRTCSANWLKMRDVRFKRNVFEHAPEERILAEHGLHTLDGYFSYWAEHNQKVLATVPKDRLLVVRTHEISAQIPRIADFLGVPPDKLERQRSHSFKAESKFDILAKLDRQFVEQKVDLHCRTLMDEYFPEFEHPRGA